MTPALHPIWIIVCGFIIVCTMLTILLTLIGLAVDLCFGTMRIVPLPTRRPRRQPLE